MDLEAANAELEKYTVIERYQGSVETPNGHATNGHFNTSSPNQHQPPKISKAIEMTEIDEDDKPVSLKKYLKSIFVMPKSMRILALTNLLCWMCHLTYCLYFTDFVGEAVFHGDPMVRINCI